MTIRAYIFWLKDFLFNHSTVKNAYNEIQEGFTTGKENIAQRELLIQWAQKEVPFYKQFDGKSFDQLPVVNKTIIRNGGDDFLAQCFRKENLHQETTSGSTGSPFAVLQDKGKRLRASADSIFFSDFAGFHLGTRLYYIRIWNHINHKSKLQTLMQNVVTQPSDCLSDNSLETFLKKLERDNQEKSILAYASSITALCRWMQRTNRKTTAKIACIISMSETLPDDARAGIKTLFGCPVISRYSNQECGLLSQQCSLETEYHVNTASFYIEILDINKDEPVEDGKLGRIVVTDLYNKAMPMIRYDTGDMGILSHCCDCSMKGKVLKRVEGRKIDFITSTVGELLSPVTVINAMWEYCDLRQWQFIQHSKIHYEMKINCGLEKYGREEEMIRDIKNYIGQDAIMDITYVDEIPLLASGKRKSVVNLMNQ